MCYDRYPDTFVYAHTCKHTHTLTHSHPHTHILTHRHTHSLTHSLTHTPQTHTHKLSHTLSHTHIHSLTLSNNHTHTDSLLIPLVILDKELNAGDPGLIPEVKLKLELLSAFDRPPNAPRDTGRDPGPVPGRGVGAVPGRDVPDPGAVEELVVVTAGGILDLFIGFDGINIITALANSECCFFFPISEI